MQYWKLAHIVADYQYEKNYYQILIARKMKYFLIILFVTPFLCHSQSSGKYNPVKKVLVYGIPIKEDTLQLVTSDELQSRSHRAGYCYFDIENTTGYFIDLWIEDHYLGRLVPFSGSVKFDIAKPDNWHKWHARTLGKKLMWENKSYCNDNRSFQLLEKVAE